MMRFFFGATVFVLIAICCNGATANEAAASSSLVMVESPKAKYCEILVPIGCKAKKKFPNVIQFTEQEASKYEDITGVREHDIKRPYIAFFDHDDVTIERVFISKMSVEEIITTLRDRGIYTVQEKYKRQAEKNQEKTDTKAE